jgi:hypothetical protein
VQALGGGRQMPEAGRVAIERGMSRSGGLSPGKWEWAVRQELGLIDSVLA